MCRNSAMPRRKKYPISIPSPRTVVCTQRVFHDQAHGSTIHIIRELRNWRDRICDPFSHAGRQVYTHLRDIHTKRIVELRRETQGHTCQLCVFIESSDPAPAAALNQSVRAVYIESLLLVPVRRTARAPETFG